MSRGSPSSNHASSETFGRRPKVAVVGHIEWVQFARVASVPAPGEIIHASEFWSEPGGAGAVAAVQLAKLAGEATFFTALGDDELGHRAHEELTKLGVRVNVAWRAEPQRRAFTFVDGRGERTITVMGSRLVPHGSDPLPWDELASIDGLYFTGGDTEALRAARAARILTATPRVLSTLRAGGVVLDALVGSGNDPGEAYRPGDLDPPPRLRVATDGAVGGWSEPGGPFPPAPLPGPMSDAYGAGDSFAAGLTYALAQAWGRDEALAFAARCGAAALTGRGAHSGQLSA